MLQTVFEDCSVAYSSDFGTHLFLSF